MTAQSSWPQSDRPVSPEAVSPEAVSPEPLSLHSAICFSLQAAADPGLMPRIVEIFARRGLVPTRLHASVGGPQGELAIDLEMTGLAQDLAARIAAEMRAVWGVSLVLTTQKRAA